MRIRSVLCALALAGCMHPAPGETPAAHVELALHRSVALRSSTAPRAIALVDVTAVAADERISLASRRDHDAHACSVARAWLDALPEGISTRVQRFERAGSAGSPCDLPTSAATNEREPWSVADATEALERIAREATGASRIAWIGDAGSEIESRLCAAAAQLSRQGAWLEIVRLDAGEGPACLATRVPLVEGPPSALAVDAAAPGFRVVRPGPSGELLARGRVGERIDVTPGPALVVLEVDPEEEIGPFLVRAGGRSEIRVFELAAPNGSSVYGWSVEESDDAR